MSEPKIVSAEEARGLLDNCSGELPWHVAPSGDPGAGKVQNSRGWYIRAEGDGDAAIMAAAPSLAHTVIALTAERDEARRERDAALATLAFNDEIAHKNSGLLADLTDAIYGKGTAEAKGYPRGMVAKVRRVFRAIRVAKRSGWVSGDVVDRLFKEVK